MPCFLMAADHFFVGHCLGSCAQSQRVGAEMAARPLYLPVEQGFPTRTFTRIDGMERC